MLRSRAMFRATRAALFVAPILVSLLAEARDALAADCQSRTVSACINSDTLWPHAGPQRFVSFAGAETIGEGRVGFGLVASYQSRPIVLHVPSPGPSGSDATAIDDQVTGTFLFAYGVTRRLELDAMLPLTFGQSGSGVSPITGKNALRDTATRDIRFGFTYALVEHPRVATDSAKARGTGVVVRFETSMPVGDKEQFAGERTAVFAPSIAADHRYGRLFVGAELGARIRPVSELVGARVGTQGLVGLGVGYDVLSREHLAVMLEARALPGFAEQATTTQSAAGLVSAPNGSMITPAEWQIGVRSAPFDGGDVSFAASGGGMIPLASEAPITTPRWRFTLGVVLAPLARDTDGDGVLDGTDRCPNEPGTKTSAAGPGCPEPAAKPVEVLDATTSTPALVAPPKAGP